MTAHIHGRTAVQPYRHESDLFMTIGNMIIRKSAIQLIRMDPYDITIWVDGATAIIIANNPKNRKKLSIVEE